jgi:hypothetical protein
LADFIRVPATTIGDDGLPGFGALKLQSVNLDKVETITSWVSDTRSTRDKAGPYLPYVLLVFLSGNELTLPLARHADFNAATCAADLLCEALTAE